MDAQRCSFLTNVPFCHNKINYNFRYAYPAFYLFAREAVQYIYYVLYLEHGVAFPAIDIPDMVSLVFPVGFPFYGYGANRQRAGD